MKKLIVIAAMVMALGMVTLAKADPYPGTQHLYDRGVDSLGYHLIYDQDLNITWYDYTLPSNYNTWQSGRNWADTLTVTMDGRVFDDWRLPMTVQGDWSSGYDGTTTGGYNTDITKSEMVHLFYEELGNKGYQATDGSYPQPGWGLVNKGPFSNLMEGTLYYGGYWSSQYYNTNMAWNFYFQYGLQYLHEGYNVWLYTMVVRDGDVSGAPVPEPATMLLLGLGLMGVAGIRRKLS
jgi:hypothetical protein